MNNLPVLYDDYFCVNQILDRWFTDESFPFTHITMDYSTCFFDVPAIYDPDFAMAQIEFHINNPTYLRFWNNEKRTLNCQECGKLLGYIHKSNEPEDPVNGARLYHGNWIVEIMFCSDCDEKFGVEWDNHPFVGDYDDING